MAQASSDTLCCQPQVAGDGFSEAAGIRRRALDIIFQSMQREQQEQQKSLARQQQLAATAGGGTSSRSSSSDLANVSPSKGDYLVSCLTLQMQKRTDFVTDE